MSDRRSISGALGQNDLHRSSRYKTWQAALPAWCLLLVFFFPVVWGNIPLNIDLLTSECVPWSLTGSSKIQNIDIDDPVLQHYPLYARATRSWRQFRVPLWNPDIACGMPLLADCHAMPLDPLCILTSICFDSARAWGILLILQFALLAAITVQFLKIRRNTYQAAVLGSIAMVFSGTCVTWCQMRLYTASILWIMAGFWAVERCCRQKGFRSTILVGISLAGLTVSGHLQFILYGWFCILAYSAWRYRLFAGFKIQVKTCSAWMLQAVWGICLSAIFWIPALELLTRTLRGVPGRYFPIFRFGWAPWITLICPDFLGNPVDSTYYGLYIFQKSYMNLPILYFGLVPLFFLCYAVLTPSPARRFFGGFSFLGLAGLTILNISPVKTGIFQLFPALFSLDPGRFAAVVIPMLVILAAEGVSLFSRRLESGEWKVMPVLFPALAVLGLTAAGTAILAAFHGSLLSKAADNSLLMYWLKLHDDHGALVMAPAILKMCTLSLVFPALILLKRLNRISRNTFWVLMLLVVAADLLPPAVSYNRFFPADNLELPVEIKNHIPESGVIEGRICGLDSLQTVKFAGRVLPPNTGLLLGAYDFRGYVSAYVDRYAELLNCIQPRTYYDRRLQVTSSPYFDAAGVRWLVSDQPVIWPGYVRVRAGQGLFLNKNQHAFPKAWCVYNTARFTSFEQLQHDLLSGQTDLSVTAYLEERIVLPESGDEPPVFPVQIVSAGDHRLEFRAVSDRTGILVVNDTYYPGWRAMINQRKSRVFPVDRVFRGVKLPPGLSKVEMIYHPVSFLLGEFCFLLTVLMISVLCMSRGGSQR
jgi:hypothetical protein